MNSATTRLGRAAFCALAVFVMADTLRAQTPPTPGSVMESLAGPRPSIPSTPAQIIIPEQPGPTIHDRKGKRFQVHSFRFVGNTVFPAQRLKRVIERYLDMELNLYDLNVAADAVTEFYHDRGYTLARAVIPAQRVEDGVVTIAIVEGRIGKVLFSGNKRYKNDFLQLHLTHLPPGSLVATDSMERTLLLLNDLPGFKARATLAPGVEFGTSDVLIKVEEKLLGLTMTVDNFGSKETGRKRADLGAEINNPLGIGDQFSVRGVTTERKLIKFGKLGYSLPLNADGLRLAASYSESRYDVAGDFAALGLSGSSRTADISLQYPLTRSRGRNETISLAFKNTQLIQQTLGVETSNTRIPMLNLGYVANRIGEDASVSNLSMQVASNLRHNSDGTRQDAQRFRLEIDGNYLLPLDRKWDVYLRGAVMFSPDRLPDSEKYSIGGPGSVRAYRVSELRGDSAGQASLEFRRSFAVGSMPGSLSLFGDTGRVVYKAPGFANAWQSISAWGAGVSIYPMRQVAVKIEAAIPGGGRMRSLDGKTGRLWASISANF
ncbi:MAG: BamA/TamA family outer membrane protein [Sulfuritalea sp.]|nr:BamA/TamA family outer membrane protein [Sulfuritalea sp.]